MMMSTIPFPSVWHIFAKPYQNITRIFPTQQADVGRMIDVCKNDPNIRKIIIFGSSVTPLCNPWSDIDIYFEMKEPPQRYPSIGSHTTSAALITASTFRSFVTPKGITSFS